jgi:hypothetical protein
MLGLMVEKEKASPKRAFLLQPWMLDRHLHHRRKQGRRPAFSLPRSTKAAVTKAPVRHKGKDGLQRKQRQPLPLFPLLNHTCTEPELKVSTEHRFKKLEISLPFLEEATRTCQTVGIVRKRKGRKGK